MLVAGPPQVRPMHASADPFTQFLQQQASALRRIARAARGEHSAADVAQEACRLAERHGRPIDFAEPAFQDLLLRHLYQALVRHTELNVRHTVRLDHAIGTDSDETTPDWRMKQLVDDRQDDPLSHWLAHEKRAGQPDPDTPHAWAWTVLLRECGQHMPSVAMRLLIPVSRAYRCCARARQLANGQHPLALPPIVDARQLGPWRMATHHVHSSTTGVRFRRPVAGAGWTLMRHAAQRRARPARQPMVSAESAFPAGYCDAVRQQGQQTPGTAMEYNVHYLTNAEWKDLRAAYLAHGNDPPFWDAYQALLHSARRRTGDSQVKVANELARVAVQLGATRKALFV